jgi:hypothetical protein
MDLGKYLFRRSKQSYTAQFSDFGWFLEFLHKIWSNGCSNKLIWAEISQTSFDSKSCDYFKIYEELEEVSMIKSVPNLISYPQEFSQVFPHLVTIFLVRKAIFENFRNMESTDRWGPPISG